MSHLGEEQWRLILLIVFLKQSGNFKKGWKYVKLVTLCFKEFASWYFLSDLYSLKSNYFV